MSWCVLTVLGADKFLGLPQESSVESEAEAACILAIANGKLSRPLVLLADTALGLARSHRWAFLCHCNQTTRSQVSIAAKVTSISVNRPDSKCQPPIMKLWKGAIVIGQNRTIFANWEWIAQCKQSYFLHTVTVDYFNMHWAFPTAYSPSAKKQQAPRHENINVHFGKLNDQLLSASNHWYCCQPCSIR